jgi:hypothetical protein
MLPVAKILENKETIIKLLTQTKRKGVKSMIDWMGSAGFFDSPASMKFHGDYEGGLAAHSLAVYFMLLDYHEKFNLAKIDAPGQNQLPINPENLVIAALLHDVCKAGAYLPNPGGKTPYKGNKAHPKGHATLSLEIIQRHITLEPLEEMMIRYHMGVYGLNEFYKPDDWQSGEYPLRGEDDKPKEERYGKSLANAWYHNPIVKVMCFCDELVTLGEKTGEQ